MSNEGLHLICEKHEKETRYCSIDKKWICITCEIEQGTNREK